MILLSFEINVKGKAGSDLYCHVQTKPYNPQSTRISFNGNGNFGQEMGNSTIETLFLTVLKSIAKPTSAAAVFSGVPTVKWIFLFLRGICCS